MTTNAFILSWDQLGIEAVVPITQYEDWDHQNLVNVLAGTRKKDNPLSQLLGRLVMRARFNSQRHYEIYAIDCDKEMTEQDWHDMFERSPQATADLVRERGVKIHSDRAETSKIKIV